MFLHLLSLAFYSGCKYRYLSMSALLRMPEDRTVYTVYGSMNLGPPVAMVDSSQVQLMELDQVSVIDLGNLVK